MMKKIIIGSLLIIGSILGVFYLKSPSAPKAHLISNERPTGGDFTLNSNHGKVSLHDFKGKVVFIYFGYTFCPDICPLNLSHISLAYNKLSKSQQKDLQVMFISVDPNRDTPKRLQNYVSYYGMNAIGLTGSLKNLNHIAKQYGVVFKSHQKNAADKLYAVDHSAFTYVINPQGKLVDQIPHASVPKVFINAFKQYDKLK